MGNCWGKLITTWATESASESYTEIVGGKLITTWATESASESYTIRGNRLTLVDDENDTVFVWERQ